MNWLIFSSGVFFGFLFGMTVTAVLVVSSKDHQAIPPLNENSADDSHG